MSDQSLEKISKANKEQISHGLLIETYCQSVKLQRDVNFSIHRNLKEYEEKINTTLEQAKTDADIYLNDIQPNILKNISNISSYYSSQNTILTKLPETATKEEWLTELEVLQRKAAEYHGTSLKTAISLRELRDKFTQDATAFGVIVSNLQMYTNGKKQELEEIKKQLTNIESQIQGVKAGIVTSGLAVASGVFIIGVGSIAEFVTAGTSTSLVILGGVLAVGGISQVIATPNELKELYAQKTSLLTDNTKLPDEVRLALGISEGFSTLQKEVMEAMTAAQQMANAWQFLGNNLDELSKNLKDDIQSTDTLRTRFDANSILQTQLIQDIDIIKEQMTGVNQLPVIPNCNMEKIIDIVTEEAKKYQ